MANSRKKCKQCKSYFPADEMIKVPAGTFCGMEHAIEFANEKRLKDSERIKSKIDTFTRSEEKKATRKRRERLSELRPLSYYHKKAQAAFNAFIRERDKDLPCVSCGRDHEGQWHAGHFRTVGASPETRYNEDNTWKQCQPCNHHLSGNIANYRPELIRRIGQERYDVLMGYQEQIKWTREMIEGIEEKYKLKLKQIKGIDR